MKTLPRVTLALMTLVGSMSLADTRSTDARPADGVEASETYKAPAENDRLKVGPAASELEQRIRALESELAQAREKEQERTQFPGAWNVGTEGP